MFKITSSTIDIYTVPNTAPLQRRHIDLRAQHQHYQEQHPTPATTNLRRKEFRQSSRNDFSMETNELFYDSSDSETSFFDDSDDNDDVTAFFGRHAHKYQNLRNGEDSSTLANQGQQQQDNNKKREITKSCEMLVSPRTERRNNKNTINNNRTIKTSHTHSSISAQQKNMTHLGFRMYSRNFSVPNLSSVEKKHSEDLYQQQTQEDSSISSFSPRLKRKQTDITKSAAFKEIYAHNLRLYSSVLAKVRYSNIKSFNII